MQDASFHIQDLGVELCKIRVYQRSSCLEKAHRYVQLCHSAIQRKHFESMQLSLMFQRVKFSFW